MACEGACVTNFEDSWPSVAEAVEVKERLSTQEPSRLEPSPFFGDETKTKRTHIQVIFFR